MLKLGSVAFKSFDFTGFQGWFVVLSGESHRQHYKIKGENHSFCNQEAEVSQCTSVIFLEPHESNTKPKCKHCLLALESYLRTGLTPKMKN